MPAHAVQEGRCVTAGSAAFGKAATLTLSEPPGDGVIAHAELPAVLRRLGVLLSRAFFPFNQRRR